MKKSIFFLILSILIISAIFINYTFLNSFFFIDEIGRVKSAQNVNLNNIFLQPYPILFILFLKLLLFLFNDIFIIRYVFFFIYLLSIIILFLYVYKWSKDYFLSFISTFLFIICARIYNNIISYYVLIYLFSIITLYWYKSIDKLTVKQIVIGNFLFLCGSLFFPFSIFFYFVIYLFLLQKFNFKKTISFVILFFFTALILYYHLKITSTNNWNIIEIQDQNILYSFFSPLKNFIVNIFFVSKEHYLIVRRIIIILYLFLILISLILNFKKLISCNHFKFYFILFSATYLLLFSNYLILKKFSFKWLQNLWIPFLIAVSYIICYNAKTKKKAFIIFLFLVVYYINLTGNETNHNLIIEKNEKKLYEEILHLQNNSANSIFIFSNFILWTKFDVFDKFDCRYGVISGTIEENYFMTSPI